MATSLEQAPLCKHCQRPIENLHGSWIHFCGFYSCSGTGLGSFAEPEDTFNDDSPIPDDTENQWP